MTATLKMTHKAIGAEVRRGTYDIVVDGQRAGSVDMKRDDRDPSRTWTSHSASSQWPQLQPN